MTELLTSFLDPLEIALLVTTFLITNAGSVGQIVGWYRRQSYLLAFVTGLTALINLLEGGSGASVVVFLIGLIVLLPFLLAQFIEPILVRATLLLPAAGVRVSEQDRYKAAQTWRKSEAVTSSQNINTLFFMSMILLAFGIAFKAIGGDLNISERVGLMVSLVLHLVGLYNMVVRRDIISQVVGLLVMDHGLYLAVVKIVAIPVPATFFVISLYFYTLITLAILLFLVPQMRRRMGTIDLNEITESSTLEG